LFAVPPFVLFYILPCAETKYTSSKIVPVVTELERDHIAAEKVCPLPLAGE